MVANFYVKLCAVFRQTGEVELVILEACSLHEMICFTYKATRMRLLKIIWDLGYRFY